MTDIVVAAAPGTYHASLGAALDAHARLGESFATNPALGDYARVQTRLTLVPITGDAVILADGRRLAPDNRFGRLAGVRMIYLPSFRTLDPERAMDDALQASAFHEWLRVRHRQGALLAACGAGVLHLAASGLADGASCSVPARLVPALSARFPAVRIAEGEPLLSDGGLFTCSREADAPALVLRLFSAGLSPSVAEGLAQRERPAGIAPLAADPLVAAAQLWIREHFAGEFRITDLAARLGTSLPTLMRRFREAGQEPPRTFAQRIRVESAAIQLVETDRPVSEIAQLVGYADVPSFRRIFIQHIGMTPGAYRRSARRARAERSAVDSRKAFSQG